MIGMLSFLLFAGALHIDLELGFKALIVVRLRHAFYGFIQYGFFIGEGSQ